jgi:hypothetical protein
VAAAADDVDLPGHAACGRCHEGRGLKPDLADCTRCHVKRASDPPRARKLIRGDLRFRHADHEADRQGRPIACVTCHARIATVSRTGVALAPTAPVCVSCHDDEARVPPQENMASCGTCHARPPGTLSRLVAPRSHLAPRDRPEDHTLAFRKDHAEEARRDARRCARCHSEVSGSGRDNCQECHQSTRPRDHNVMWADFEHGPEAAASADRCARCHTGEYCIACHSIPPRSHIAFGSDPGNWIEHQAAARLNPGSCRVCHNVSSDRYCAQCHGSAR